MDGDSMLSTVVSNASRNKTQSGKEGRIQYDKESFM